MTRTQIRELAIAAAVTAAASAIAASMASALTTYLITRAAAGQEKKEQASAFARQLMVAQTPLYQSWLNR